MLFLGLILGSIGCGAMGAYTARERSRPPWEGACFGALLGPLGILVEALLPPNRPKPSREDGDEYRVSTERWDTDRRNWFPRLKL